VCVMRMSEASLRLKWEQHNLKLATRLKMMHCSTQKKIKDQLKIFNFKVKQNKNPVMSISCTIPYKVLQAKVFSFFIRNT